MHLLRTVCLLAVWGLVASSVAAATNVVRCARYQEFGFCTQRADGTYVGANMAFVARLAEMNGWQVAWVDCSAAEAIERLADGRLDLVPGLSYTEARARRFHYPHLPMFDYGAELVVHDGADIDLVARPGRAPLVVATGSDDRLNDQLERRLRQLGLSYRLLNCPSFVEARRQFYLGRANALLSLGPFDQDGERTLMALPSVPGFICVARGRSDLQQALNRSLIQLREDDPSFASDVVHRSFPVLATSRMALTPEERDWLRTRVEQGGVVRVDLSPLLPPLKLWDARDRAPRGFVKALFAEVTRRTGLVFAFLEPGTSQTARTRFLSGEADVWVDFGSVVCTAQVDADHRVDLKMPQLLVCRRDTALADPGVGKISVPAWDRTRLDDYRHAGYGARVVVCRDSLDAVEAVRDGRSDATFLSPLLASTILRELNAEQILEARVASRPQSQVCFSLATSPQASPHLAGVLKKTLGGLASEDLSALMLQASHESIRRPILSTRGWIVAVCLGVTVVLFLVGFLDMRQASLLEQAAVEQARQLRQRDEFFERTVKELDGPIDAIEARAECLRTPDASRALVLEWTEGLIRNADDLVGRLRTLIGYARMKRAYADKWREAGGGGSFDD